MGKMEEVIEILPMAIRWIFQQPIVEFEQLQEIRLRAGLPLQIRYRGEGYFIDGKGKLRQTSSDGIIISKKQIQESMDYISYYSVYAFQDQLKYGFLTVRGGHRVGVAGKVMLRDGKIIGMKYISGMNIRVAHEQKRCGKQVFPWLFEGEKLCHTLIISPPGFGKTTLLRDLIRMLSNYEYQVSVVDERSEIGASYHGIPQNEIGARTDLMDGCPKAEGISMMIRSMTPEIIAVDEIGTKEDVEALQYGRTCGCVLLGTIHGNSIEDVRRRNWTKEMFLERWFERYILLEGIGKVKEIDNEKGERICGSLQL